MDFAFTEEQQMLLDMTRRFTKERCRFEQRKAIMHSPLGFDRAHWAELAELGLLALNVAEEHGGMNAGPIESMLVCQVMGEALTTLPWLSSAVCATRAISLLTASEQQKKWFPEMMAGRLIVTLAHDESEFDAAKSANSIVAENHADAWVLQGRRETVWQAASADLLLVPARGEGAHQGKILLFAIPRDQDGVSMETFATLDGQRAAHLTFDQARLDQSNLVCGDAERLLQQVLDETLAGLCAEAMGALEKIQLATIEYSRNRVQFGVPIGRFQALQHRMADMQMHVEQARSMCLLAASRCRDSDALQRRSVLSSAKALIGQAARFVGQQAVQLHGGMGMTDELIVSHYFKRLLAFELRLGGNDSHLEQYRRLNIAQ